MGKNVELHHVRTKDGAEVDFALSDQTQGEPHLTDLIECILADTKPHPALKRFAAELTQTQAVQLLRDIRHEQDLGAIQLRGAANWLMALSA